MAWSGQVAELCRARLLTMASTTHFIRQIGETLQPSTSALFVLVRKAQPEKVMNELSSFRGRVIRSSLSPEQEKRLQEALSGSGMAMPGTPTSAAAQPGPAAGAAAGSAPV